MLLFGVWGRKCFTWPMTKIVLVILFLCSLSAFPQATPVAVSTVTVSGNVVTVNTGAAHGLNAGQGFCTTGSSVPSEVLCAVVGSTPTATSFLYNFPAVVACASSCGTVQPAKKIVILQESHYQAIITIMLLFWNPNRSGILSAHQASMWAGSSAAESAAIANGRMFETSKSVILPDNATKAQRQQVIAAAWQAVQAEFDNNPQPAGLVPVNCFFDTSWSC